MRDKIIAALKTTYANLGLSDKAFGGVASILEKTVTNEEGIAAAVGAPEIALLVKAIQGETDSLRNKNVQIAKELEELKKQTPGQKEPEKEPDVNTKLAERIAALENTLLENDKKAKREARLASIKEKLVSGGSKNENILGLVLKDAALDDNETDETAVERLKKTYDSTYRQFYGNGPIPPAGGGGGAGDKNPDKSLIDTLRKNGSLPGEDNNH